MIKKYSSTLILLIVFSTSAVQSADPEPTKKDPTWMTEARASIKTGKFDLAISQLQTANEVTSADWNNLMGYSLRKKQPADLAGAQQHYEDALKIDPSHKGALEYYGALKLINNDLPGAEALLARLDKICVFSCEEYRDLKKAIQAYKKK